MKLVLFFCLFLVACSNVPIRTCKTLLWEMENLPCLLREDENGLLVRLCPEDPDYPKDAISITIESYNCERDFQDLLINKCEKFSK